MGGRGRLPSGLSLVGEGLSLELEWSDVFSAFEEG